MNYILYLEILTDLDEGLCGLVIRNNSKNNSKNWTVIENAINYLNSDCVWSAE
jgi:hypothetical protein